MTAKLFADMMNLKNHVRTFPIVDYKVPFKDFSKFEEVDKQNFKVYKQLRSKTRQTDISDFFK
jgi:glutathione peroxidase-family protein